MTTRSIPVTAVLNSALEPGARAQTVPAKALAIGVAAASDWIH